MTNAYTLYAAFAAPNGDRRIPDDERAGRDEHVPLPSAAVVDDVLGKADELGYAGRDIAALHVLLARLAGASALP